MLKILFLVFVVFFFGCDKNSGGDNPGTSNDVLANFSTSALTISEGQLDQVIKVQLTEAVSGNTSINIRVESTSVNFESRFFSSPRLNNGIITAIVEGGNTETEILISTNQDVDQISENINFEIERVNGNNVGIGNTKSTTLTIMDQTQSNPQYLNCLPQSSNDTLEIGTWNIKFLPQGPGTVDALIQMIGLMDIDIIAIQEIQDPSMFEAIADGIAGWEAKWLNVNGDIELGYLYKTSEIIAISELSALFENDFSPFPREAVAVDISHVSGLQAKLINIHLKCCSDSADRRANASAIMKAYVDDNLSNEQVIILGDFNEAITGNNSFDNFLQDPDNYFFADAGIAAGSSEHWSFPNFPSHIDHLLCTNELMDAFVSSETMNVDPCAVGFGDVISDHRPVIARFK